MRQTEITHASFFQDWLNKKNGTDFIVNQDHKTEDSHIDVILSSKKLDKKIFIQNVAYRGEGLVYSTDAIVSGDPALIKLLPKLKMALVPTQYDKKKSIETYIRKKEIKYPEDLVKNLVLLVEATIPSVRPDELSDYFPNGIETMFSGIYFVQLPIPMVDVNDKWGQTGFVFPLKEPEFKSR